MRIACLAGVLMAVAAAQERPETVIRTTTRLVQIRVMAEDSKGDPVTDLRKEEIQLLDNRQARPVQFLVREDGGVGSASVPGANGKAEESPETRNDYAVIVLDWLNPNFASRLRARENAIKLLQRFQPRQQVALFLIAKHSRLLHDFTSNPAELLDVLTHTEEELSDPFAPSNPGQGDPRLDAWKSLTVEERLFGFNNLVLDTIEELGKLADGLGRIPGRKTVIWMTNGFPIVLDGRAVPGQKQEAASYRESVEPLADKLNRANVALYTVDARGLPIGDGYGAVDTLQELSERTGATAFYARNDLDEGMRLAFEDSKTGYTLGFTLDSDAAPGVHDIRLKTTRRGVTLRYRESYQLDAR